MQLLTAERIRHGSEKSYNNQMVIAQNTYRVGYLNEFVFRFNRRFWPMVGFDSVLKFVAQVEPMTDREFYEGSQI